MSTIVRTKISESFTSISNIPVIRNLNTPLMLENWDSNLGAQRLEIGAISVPYKVVSFLNDHSDIDVLKTYQVTLENRLDILFEDPYKYSESFNDNLKKASNAILRHFLIGSFLPSSYFLGQHLLDGLAVNNNDLVFFALLFLTINLTGYYYRNSEIRRIGKEHEMEQAYTSLNESKSMLHGIMDNNPMSIQVVDHDGFLLEHNSAFIRLFGEAPPPGFSIFADLQNKGFVDYIQRLKNGEVVNLPDIFFNAHDVVPQAPDIPLWIRATMFPINVSSDKHDQFVLMHENVTERKKAEEGILASEIKLKTITDSAREGIVMLGHDGKIQFWNPAAEKLFGYTKEESIGRNLHSLIMPEEYLPIHEPAFENYVRTGEGLAIGKTIELEAKRKDGSLFPVALSISTAILNGKRNSIGVIQDITNRKRSEKEICKLVDELRFQNKVVEENASQLAESEAKLRDAIIAKDKMFSIIGHDLRGPVGTMSNLLQILKEDFNSSTPKENMEIIDLVTKSAGETYQLLDNLLTWSRTQGSGVMVKKVSNQLSETVNDVVSKLNLIAKSKFIMIFASIDNTYNVLFDMEMLKVIIRNIVSNALKFTDQFGVITICAKEEGDNIILSVTDTGEGMSSKLLDNLFKLGVDNSTRGTAGEKGTGLGLLLCKEFIDKNDGKIWVKSEVGVGTTFYVSLPKTKAD